jgi:hypothetical protein
MPPATRSRAVFLEIAGLRLRVTGATGEAREWLLARYEPFMARAAGPAVTIHLRLERRRRRGPVEPRLTRVGRRLHLALGPCRATIDADAGLVRLLMPRTAGALSPSALRLLCALLLLERGGFLLHASAVVEHDRAWVFCGPSGAGKTTVARLASPRLVLSDETVALLNGRAGCTVASTPFFGEGGPVMATLNRRAPVAGLCFLTKGDRFAHRRLDAREVVERAFHQVFVPKRDPRIAARVLERLADVAARVPCFELTFARRPELWEYLGALA